MLYYYWSAKCLGVIKTYIHIVDQWFGNKKIKKNHFIKQQQHIQIQFIQIMAVSTKWCLAKKNKNVAFN